MLVFTGWDVVDVKGLSEKRFVSGLIDIYDSRSVLYVLLKRDFFGRNKVSYLGFMRSFITPLLTVLLLWGVFTGIGMNEDPYFWVYLCLGVFPFQFLVNCVTGGCACIANNASMIKKTYFPREIPVLSQIIGNTIPFIVSVALIVILMLFVGYPMDALAALSIVLGLVLTIIFGAGITLLVAAATVLEDGVRDIMYAVVGLVFWVTPVFYALDSLTGWMHTVVLCNPITYYVEFFHQSLYYATVPDPSIVVGSVMFALVFAIIGILVFNKYKERFAEMIRWLVTLEWRMSVC